MMGIYDMIDLLLWGDNRHFIQYYITKRAIVFGWFSLVTSKKVAAKESVLKTPAQPDNHPGTYISSKTRHLFFTIPTNILCLEVCIANRSKTKDNGISVAEM